jgi:hypothetical protein
VGREGRGRWLSQSRMGRRICELCRSSVSRVPGCPCSVLELSKDGKILVDGVDRKRGPDQLN